MYSNYVGGFVNQRVTIGTFVEQSLGKHNTCEIIHHHLRTRLLRNYIHKNGPKKHLKK